MSQRRVGDGAVIHVGPADATRVVELERRYADHVLPVTLEIARIWGGMSLERSLAPIDGLMAATAVHHGMTLVTRNVADVERSGAEVFNPFAPG